jgi:hypothetical protein
MIETSYINWKPLKTYVGWDEKTYIIYSLFDENNYDFITILRVAFNLEIYNEGDWVNTNLNFIRKNDKCRFIDYELNKEIEFLVISGATFSTKDKLWKAKVKLK